MLWAKYDRTCAAVGTQTTISICWLNHLYLLETSILILIVLLIQPKLNQALLEMFRVDYIGNLPYISCTPSVLHHHLCSSDRFLVLSSDGLYQYFSNEEVVSHITWFMENAPDGDPAQYLIAELLIRAAKKNGQSVINHYVYNLWMSSICVHISLWVSFGFDHCTRTVSMK